MSKYGTVVPIVELEETGFSISWLNLRRLVLVYPG